MGEVRKKPGWVKQEDVGEKPWGGFAPLTVGQVCEVWAAYKSGRISWLAVRVFFGALELSKTRCGVGEGARVRFRRDEIYPLVSARSKRTVDQALAELRAARLTAFSSEELRFTREYSDDAIRMVAELGRHPNSQIPIPRFIAKRIARSARAPEAGTILGLMARCLFRKKRTGHAGYACVSAGACSARLIADVFGLNKTTVQNARKRLRAEGWVVFDEDQPTWHEKRFGQWTVLSLTWGRPALIGAETGTVRAENAQQPERHIQSSSSSKKNYQNPERRSASGFQKKFLRAGRVDRRDITPEVLRTNELALELFHQCVARGEIGASDAERLEFFSMIELSLSKGRDPVRYFVSLLKRRGSEISKHGHLQTDVATDGAEDSARRRLRELEGKAREGNAPPIRSFGEDTERVKVPEITRAQYMALGELERRQYELLRRRAESGVELDERSVGWLREWLAKRAA